MKPSHPVITSSPPCIKIDKGVPMPVARGPRQIGVSKVFRALEIGDSFVYPAATGTAKTINNASRHSAQVGKPMGRTFACRTVEENGEKVVRVWRTA